MWDDVCCPIREFTADGVNVGRCWFHLSGGKTCPRHGNVSEAVERYKATGKLTDDSRELQRRSKESTP